MKITLWQQFSSNHSAMYTIVGVFPNAVQAKKAGEKVTEIVTNIAKWSEKNRHQLTSELSPVEEHYAQKYGIDWQEPIDWLRPFPTYYRKPYQRLPQEHIVIQDNLVFVDAPGASDTWQDGHHFVDLIKVLGGEPFKSIYMGEPPHTFGKNHFADVVCNLSCIASSIQDASRIAEILQRYTEARNNANQNGFFHWLPMPWAIHHQRYYLINQKMPPEKYPEYESVWINEHRQQHEYFLRHRNAQFRLSDEQYKIYDTFIKQDGDIAAHIDMFRRDTEFNVKNIKYSSNTVELTHLNVDVYALPALIEWMKAQGCEVKYVLEQEYDEIG